MTFILEGLEQDKLKHLDHAEDLPLRHGNLGFNHIYTTLMNTHDYLTGKAPKNYNVTMKYDGCVHETTIIKTSIGDISIKDLIERVKSGENIKVFCKDFETNENKWSPVLDYLVKEGSKKWVEVGLEDGSNIIITEDHELHTSNKGWIAAGSLLEGDDITEI